MDQSSFDETTRMLAQANLHRMRGQWEEAAAVCMEAMRLSPNNATAHSLLGDIYSDQGKLDEAIRWYCMALDIQPTSRADRAKLTRLVENKRQALIAADQKDPHSTLRLRRRRNGLIAERTTLGHGVVWKHARTLRFAVIGIAVLMLVTILATPFVLRERARHQNAFGALTMAGRQINAAPVYLQPVVPAFHGAGASLTAAGPTTLRDPFDQSIVDGLRSDTSLLYQGVQIADAQSDPRVGRLVLTFLDNPGNAPTNDMKSQILSNSLRLVAAAAARTSPSQINQFTVRCLLLTAPQSQDSGATLPSTGTPITATTPLVFVADISRDSVSSANAGQQSPVGLEAHFTSPWFSPSLP